MAKQSNTRKAQLAEARAALASYWAGSISASVMADYASGNVKVIRAGDAK